MADNPILHAERRTVTGKAVRHLRREGITPIVVYGAHTASVTLQVGTKELLHVLSQTGGTHLIAIEVAGEKTPRMALAREMQRHVTRLTPLHADFLEVNIREKVTSVVPLVIVGEPELAHRGLAVVNHLITSVTIEALPTEIPSSIHIDASHLAEIDDAVYVRDLTADPRVRILNDPDEVVLRLAPTRRSYMEEELDEGEAAPERAADEES